MPPEEQEINRIVSLPARQIMDAEELEIFCMDHVLAPAFEAGERLFDVQAQALQDYKDLGGGILPISVGWGKTGICLMIANEAYRQGLRKIMLMLPPGLVKSLLHRHIPEWRRRVALNVPFHFLAGRSRAARKAIADAGASGVYVMPYSLLHRPDAIYLLDKVAPELVIADEAHNLKNPKVAQTKRVMEYLKERQPQFVAMSGTMSEKRVQEYQHLAAAALGDSSPLPLNANTSFLLGQIINSTAGRPEGYGKRLMAPLVMWAERQFPGHRWNRDETESYRRAYKMRFLSAPGIVATSGDNDIGVSLVIENLPVPDPDKRPQWDRLQELINQVDEEMVTPTGDIIDHAIHKHKWLSELAGGGFYNSLVWPTAEELALTRAITVGQAAELLERAKIHHAAVQEYHKILREFFKDSPPGLDTPKLVGLSCHRHGPSEVGEEVYRFWAQVKEKDFDGRPERKRVPVRICDFKVHHAAAWAAERGRGIIWYWHNELGKWLTETLADAGLNPLYAPAGDAEELESVGDPGRGGKGDRVVVASLGSHGTGRNLQAFQDMLYLQWPRRAALAEQSIGRIHRNGQKADSITINTTVTEMFESLNFAACLNDAIYAQQTMGSRQRIIMADYVTPPKIFSPEFLRERGFVDAKVLTGEQRQMLKNHFGWDGTNAE